MTIKLDETSNALQVNTPDTLSSFSPSSIKSSKKIILSCRIISHTIQRCTSPKKNALDPLRYIPERASFIAQFALSVQFEDTLEEHQVVRSYNHFSTLHNKLQKKFPKSKLPKQLPTMRKKRYDNEYIEETSQHLNEYLKQLLELPEVRACQVLRDFLEDSTMCDDHEEEDALAFKVMEGLPGTVVTVRAGQSFSVTLDLQRPGEVASWQFTTKKHNIGFSATFNGEVVHVYSREEAHVKPVKGSFKCTEPGTLTLDWDNTYTWSKTKVLVYRAEVEQPRVIASQFPEGLGSLYNLDSTKSITDATPMLIDNRRAGFIAQTRSPSLYPRSIVNSSINLLTKSFIGKPDGAEFKSGWLIIERYVQFRGRQWYRKWFVLDTRKCLLRYYDSEAAARKGLSLGTMHLSAKHTSLAITSLNEAAPSPYLFMLRSRNRAWKICSSTVVERTEWEHAISTAILIAQQKRRNQKTLSDNAPIDASGERGGSKSESLTSSSNQCDGSQSHTDRGDPTSDDSEDDESEDDSEEEVNEMDMGNAIVPISSNDPEQPILYKATPESDTRKQPLSRPLRARRTTMSLAKKMLFIIWINSLMLAIRSATSLVVASMAFVVNAYIIVHVIESRSH